MRSLVLFVPSSVFNRCYLLSSFYYTGMLFSRCLVFFLTTNVSQGTLCLALSLVCMHSVTAPILALTKFSYSSFGVRASDIS